MYRSQRPSGKPKPPIAERRPKISQDVPLRRSRGVCEGRRDLRIACHDGGGLSVAGTSGDVSSTEGAWRVCPCLPLLGREATVWTRGAEVVDSGGSLCLRTVDPTWRGAFAGMRLVDRLAGVGGRWRRPGGQVSRSRARVSVSRRMRDQRRLSARGRSAGCTRSLPSMLVRSGPGDQSPARAPAPAAW